MSPWKYLCCCLFALSLLGPELLADGKLGSVRKAVRGDDDEDDEEHDHHHEEKKGKLKRARNRSRNHDHHHHHYHDGGDSQGFIFFNQGPDYYPSVPQQQIEPVELPELFFWPYPYAYDEPGYLTEVFPGEEEADRKYLRWSGRASIENGNDFCCLNRARFKIRFESSGGFGIQSRFNFYTEHLQGNRTDNLFLNTTDLLFRFISEEELLMYIGVGFHVLNDDIDTNLGVNLTFGVDVFPVKPFVISLVVDIGSIDEAEIFHGRATFGVLLNRWEIFAGYDFRSFGGVQLYGPLGGLRFWF